MGKTLQKILTMKFLIFSLLSVILIIIPTLGLNDGDDQGQCHSCCTLLGQNPGGIVFCPACPNFNTGRNCERCNACCNPTTGQNKPGQNNITQNNTTQNNTEQNNPGQGDPLAECPPSQIGNEGDDVPCPGYNMEQCYIEK